MAGTPDGPGSRRRPAGGAAAKQPEGVGDRGHGSAEHRRFRAAALKDRVNERVNERRARLEASRTTSPRVDAAFRLVERHTEAGGALLAGAIAFRIFLFLVPCVFVIVFGLGIGTDLGGADPRDVARSLGMAGLAASAVDVSAATAATTRWVTFAFALLAFVLGARNLLRAILLIHVLIWRLPLRKPRHLTVNSLAVIGIFLGGTLVLRAVYLSRELSLAAWVIGLVLFSAVPAAIWLVSSLVLFPHPQGATWRDLLPGALLLGVGVEALHLATILWFAPYLQSKSQTYGAIGAAIAILVWAYVLGRFMTGAVTLNAVLWHRTSHSPYEERDQDGPD